MPLCKFPEKARYSGTGDVNSAANWTCPAHDRSLLHIGPNGAQAGLASGDEPDD
jgi:feruloyl esterase